MSAAFHVIPPMVRKPLGRIYRRAVAPAYAWRARNVLRDFAAHHRAAKAAFTHDGGTADLKVASVEAVGVRVCVAGHPHNFIDLPADYLTIVDGVHEEMRRRLTLTSQCSFFPGPVARPVPERTEDVPELRNGDVIAVKLRDPLDIRGLEDVCHPLMEQLERHVRTVSPRHFGNLRVVGRDDRPRDVARGERLLD